MFSPEELQQIAQKTLPPADGAHRIAIVGTVDKQGAQVVIGFTSDNERWAVTGAVRTEWSGDTQVSAQVIYKR